MNQILTSSADSFSITHYFLQKYKTYPSYLAITDLTPSALEYFDQYAPLYIASTWNAAKDKIKYCNGADSSCVAAGRPGVPYSSGDSCQETGGKVSHYKIYDLGDYVARVCFFPSSNESRVEFLKTVSFLVEMKL